MRGFLFWAFGAFLCNIAHAELAVGFTPMDQLDPAKKTVCAMTLNSSDEIQIFQKYLAPKGFQFVELVSDSWNWLEEAVNKNVRCDILVVSGHFGGSFFGHRGRLSLETLETQACREEARDLLRSAREVFLFGCNTLAGKEKDSRTPEEYRRVLMEDGFTADQAEQVAAFRYSPVGQTFHSRMARVFTGVPRIYGYSSVGPSGASVSPSLHRYFQRVDYNSYFDTITTEKNKKLFTALRGQAIEQTQGASATGERPSRCFLADKKVSDSAKLKWVAEVLRDPEQRLQNLSEISAFLLENPQSTPQFNFARREIQILAKDAQVRDEMNSLITRGLKSYPTMQLQLIAIAQYFGWLSSEEGQRLGGDIAAKYFEAPMAIEVRDTLCSIGRELSPYVTFRMVDKKLDNKLVLDALKCIAPRDPAIAWALVEILAKGSSIELRDLAVYSLRAINPQDARLHLSLVQMLRSHPDWAVQSQTLYVLVGLKPRDLRVHMALVDILKNHSDMYVRGQAVYALTHIKPRDTRVVQALVEVMRTHSEKRVRNQAIQVLEAIGQRNPSPRQISR